MLKRFDDAMRAAAERVASADRDTRRALVRVAGREDRYTEKFATLVEERLGGFSDGGVSWDVVSNVTDKQSGQETRTGADLLIAIKIDFGGLDVSKGIQVQSKINHHKRHGFGVDSRARLSSQCRTMTSNSPASYVFAFGEQVTKVFNAGSVIDADGGPITDLVSQTVSDFFYDFFICRAGDRNLRAKDHRSLQQLTRRLESKSAILLKAKAAPDR